MDTVGFTVKIDTNSAAFDDGMTETEVARILRKIADQLEAGFDFYTDRTEGGTYLQDVNGNTVGYATFD